MKVLRNRQQNIPQPLPFIMTNQEKAKFIDAFLLGLKDASFPSSFASILELRQLPSEANKDKFRLLEFEVEKHDLVEFVRGRDNSTLSGQCEYFISGKGLEYVLNGKSTIDIFEHNMDINWQRAYNRFFKVVNVSGTDSYMSGTQFLNLAREIDDSIPTYSKFIEQRNESGLNTSRKDYYFDVIDAMSDDEKLDFYNSAIEELETKTPVSKDLPALKSLFAGKNSVIKKVDIPSAKLPQELYNDVLETIHNCYRSAEQKPSLYKGKGEEDLRDLALAFLESRYQSAVASGESFNKEGKTDIILKSEQGENLFVAECKVWHGAEQFHKTIEQLFGYLTWRDTKASLIFFVRNKKFSDVLEKIKTETAKSPYFVSHVSDRNETSFSFKFKHKEDDNREVQIEVMAFSFTDN